MNRCTRHSIVENGVHWRCYPKLRWNHHLLYLFLSQIYLLSRDPLLSPRRLQSLHLLLSLHPRLLSLHLLLIYLPPFPLLQLLHFQHKTSLFDQPHLFSPPLESIVSFQIWMSSTSSIMRPFISRERRRVSFVISL